MECIEARAFKSSVLSKISMKSNTQAFLDDVWCFAGLNNVGSGDDFSIDDLLDFSGKSPGDGESSLGSEEDDGLKRNSCLASPRHPNSDSRTVSGTDDFGSLSSGQLPLPDYDMENLEWLSQFVDESSPELSSFCPNPCFQPLTGKNRLEPVISQVVQRKPRSKRPRLSGKVWSYLSARPVHTESSSSFSRKSPGKLVEGGVDFSAAAEKSPPAKKRRRESLADSGVSLRRCSHCQVQKTPQWRTGPMGPKTLCNACGVRYKSGRLFPEYRPACSPTFSGVMHSNSHRKVLEMRRKKEVAGAASLGGESSR
ncbi:unnamed protein product [Cuscuta campestris]|uniref:GATA transcription factor n=2 Tax=Cuscuta sect. Cleistogrammica TaxID=1824901 RepID=A0A484LQ07_9ASTE|nr:hypothetical protein DM860_003256 [Cuscuta australis]VFQ78364.1 unnamed protein product [Cuscuta campestris]